MSKSGKLADSGTGVKAGVNKMVKRNSVGNIGLVNILSGRGSMVSALSGNKSHHRKSIRKDTSNSQLSEVSITKGERLKKSKEWVPKGSTQKRKQ